MGQQMIELSKVDVGSNIRSFPDVQNPGEAPISKFPKEFQEAVEGLAVDIKARGLIHPITVEECDGGSYRLVAGFCRYKALQKLGTTIAEAKVVKGVNHRAYQLAENIHRLNLNPMDAARALEEEMIEQGITSQNALAKRVGKSPAWVSQIMGLLKADPELQKSVVDGEIGLAGARQIASIPKHEQAGAVRAAKEEAAQAGKKKVSAKGARRQAQNSKRKSVGKQIRIAKLEEREEEQRKDMIEKFLSVEYGDKKVPAHVRETCESFWKFLVENRRIYFPTTASAAKKAPAKKAPAKKAPAKKAPVKKAPAKKAPVKKAPVKKAPAKKAPVKKVPAKSSK